MAEFTFTPLTKSTFTKTEFTKTELELNTLEKMTFEAGKYSSSQFTAENTESEEIDNGNTSVDECPDPEDLTVDPTVAGRYTHDKTRGKYNTDTFPHLRPFRFWCQHVLPLTYDDSLSYYELLCKIHKILNECIRQLEGLEEDFEHLLDCFAHFTEDIEYFVDSSMKDFADYINENFSEFADYINTNFDSFEDFINTTFENLVKFINDNMDSMEEFINTNFQNLVDFVNQSNQEEQDWINNSFTDMVNWINTEYGTIQDFINSSFADIVSYINTQYSSIADFINTNWSALVSWCQNNYDSVVDFVNENLSNQVDSINNFYQEITDYVNNYFNNLDVQNEINNKLDDLVNDGTLEDLLKDLINSGEVSTVIDNSVTNVVQNYITQNPTEIIDALTSKSSTIFTAWNGNSGWVYNEDTDSYSYTTLDTTRWQPYIVAPTNSEGKIINTFYPVEGSNIYPYLYNFTQLSSGDYETVNPINSGISGQARTSRIAGTNVNEIFFGARGYLVWDYDVKTWAILNVSLRYVSVRNSGTDLWLLGATNTPDWCQELSNNSGSTSYIQVWYPDGKGTNMNYYANSNLNECPFMFVFWDTNFVGGST